MIRPLHDGLLVRLDRERPISALLVTTEPPRVRTATVIAVGPGRARGKLRTPMDLGPGDRIAFFREHLDHKNGRAMAARLHALGDDLALLRAPDVLFAFDGDVEVSA